MELIHETLVTLHCTVGVHHYFHSQRKCRPDTKMTLKTKDKWHSSQTAVDILALECWCDFVVVFERIEATTR